MSPRGNNMIPCGHFHKQWQRHVKTWFNQNQKKVLRKRIRQRKARAIAPKPLKGPLRPIVHCASFRYNRKVRPGRGFTLAEIKKAGYCANFALTIGVSVDHRRRNKSVELLQKNVQRLREYRSKLILFPSNKVLRKQKNPSEEYKLAVQNNLKVVFPVRKMPGRTQRARIITDADKKVKVFQLLRIKRTKMKTNARRRRNQNAVRDDQDPKI